MFVSLCLFYTEMKNCVFSDLGSLIFKHARLKWERLFRPPSCQFTILFSPHHARRSSEPEKWHFRLAYLLQVCFSPAPVWHFGDSLSARLWLSGRGNCSGECQEGSGCSEQLCCHFGPAQTRSRCKLQSAGGLWIIFMSLPSDAHLGRSYSKPALKLTGPFCELVGFI